MTEKEILALLAEVRHPAKGDKSIVELGMVTEVSLTDKAVHVTLGFPKRRDPLTEYLVGSTRAALYRGTPSGTEVDVKAVVKEEAPAAKKPNVNDLTLDELNNVRHIIGIASGKGGVGPTPMSMARPFP